MDFKCIFDPATCQVTMVHIDGSENGFRIVIRGDGKYEAYEITPCNEYFLGFYPTLNDAIKYTKTIT
jgi:hypothetical protein